MRVLVLLTEAFGGRGGIAQFNRDMLLALSAYDQDTRLVVLPRNIHETSPEIPPNIAFRSSSAGSKTRFVVRALEAAVTERFDCVLCAHIHLLPLAALIAGSKRIPLLLVIYGIEAWVPRSRMARWAMRLVTVVVSISDFTLCKFRTWTSIGADRCVIVPCTIDTERFRPASKRPDLLARYGLKDGKVLLTVARLSEHERYKGIDEVLDALPTLIQRFPTLRYLIVGEGSDRCRLEQKAADLGVTDHVTFTGYLSEHEKVDHYNLADVYVMPSRGEGFGIVFLEALACGLPVIASSVDASREAVLGGRIGATVDPRSGSAVLRAITDALDASPPGVPEQLDYFARSAFELRWHRAVDLMRSHGPTSRFTPAIAQMTERRQRPVTVSSAELSAHQGPDGDC